MAAFFKIVLFYLYLVVNAFAIPFSKTLVPFVRSSCEPTGEGFCSSNLDCKCFTLAIGAQICADSVISCSKLVPCDWNNITCPTLNTVCVTNTRCQRPVCYPIEAANPGLCPPAAFLTTTTKNPGVLLPVPGTTVISNIPNRPAQISIGVDGSLYVVVEANDNKVRRYVLSDPVISSIVAGQGGFGHFADDQLSYPIALFVDASSNVYVAHGTRYYIMLWKKNAATGIKVAGDGNYASNAYYGLAVDSKGNIYASDCDKHRVIKFAPFSTNGTILIGTGTRGNDSQSLSCPHGLFLDEPNSHLYVSDTGNHRIQRYTLNSSPRIITVAGGKGAGLDADQLKSPTAICMSKKTGALYIADGGNSRVQKWSPGATYGLTVAGTGAHGNGVTQLYVASGVVLSLDEAFLYVSDSLNQRIQRFPLI